MNNTQRSLKDFFVGFWLLWSSGKQKHVYVLGFSQDQVSHFAHIRIFKRCKERVSFLSHKSNLCLCFVFTFSNELESDCPKNLKALYFSGKVDFVCETKLTRIWFASDALTVSDNFGYHFLSWK